MKLTINGIKRYIGLTRSRARFSTLRIHEVTPRDGLQNEDIVLSTDDRFKLISGLVMAGFKSIEIGSFVREDLLPQMAKTDILCHEIHSAYWFKTVKDNNVSFAALVPNLRGYQSVQKVNERSVNDTGYRVIDTITLMTSCTETHSQKNVGMSVSEALSRNKSIIQAAQEDGMKIRAYVSLAFGCPFEGAVDSYILHKIIDEYVSSGVTHVNLADTWGSVTLENFERTLNGVLAMPTMDRKVIDLGLHMHNASNRAADCLKLAYQEFGITHWDSAIGGCGGCSFIKGAKGNVSTESVLDLSRELNLDSDLDRTKVKEINEALEIKLNRQLLQFAS